MESVRKHTINRRRFTETLGASSALVAAGCATTKSNIDRGLEAAQYSKLIVDPEKVRRIAARLLAPPRSSNLRKIFEDIKQAVYEEHAEWKIGSILRNYLSARLKTNIEDIEIETLVYETTEIRFIAKLKEGGKICELQRYLSDSDPIKRNEPPHDTLITTSIVIAPIGVPNGELQESISEKRLKLNNTKTIFHSQNEDTDQHAFTWESRLDDQGSSHEFAKRKSTSLVHRYPETFDEADWTVYTVKRDNQGRQHLVISESRTHQNQDGEEATRTNSNIYFQTVYDKYAFIKNATPEELEQFK